MKFWVQFLVGANFIGFNGVVLSVVSDVPVDSEAPVVIWSISRIFWLSLSEVLVGVRLCACIHRDKCTWDKCACMFMSICVCTVFLKKQHRRPTAKLCKFLLFENLWSRESGLQPCRVQR
jgi:hypothetical protein